MAVYQDVYVVWRCDEDDYFVTLLQYDPAEWESVKQLPQVALVEQAHDAEYPDEPNRVTAGERYECIAVFSGDNIIFQH